MRAEVLGDRPGSHWLGAEMVGGAPAQELAFSASSVTDGVVTTAVSIKEKTSTYRKMQKPSFASSRPVRLTHRDKIPVLDHRIQRGPLR